jgi:hypothetical protein
MPSKRSSSSQNSPRQPSRPEDSRRAGDAAHRAAAVPWVKRPWYWLQDLLRRPVRLERRGLQIHVTLAPPVSVQTLAGTVSVMGSGEALREAHMELRALLDQHPKARSTMRHLAFLEKSLRRHGARAFRQELPVPVLKKCQEQLDLLAAGDSSAGIAELRHRLRSAVADRAHEPSGFGLSQPVHVSEASHSLFDEMERSWTGAVPPAQPLPKPPEA